MYSGGLIHTFSGWLLHGEKGEDMLETYNVLVIMMNLQ